MLTRLRGLWRAARSLPVLRPLLGVADRFWWARTIRRADIVDTGFAAGQLGRPLTDRQAVRAYVRGGFRSGLTLNPLFAERLVSRQLPDADRVPAMYAYLIADQRDLETSLAWDAPLYARSDRFRPGTPGGVLGSAWRTLRAGGTIVLRGGGSTDLGALHAAALGTASLAGPAAEAMPHTVLLWQLDGDDADGEGLRGALGVLRDDEVASDGLRLILDVSKAPQDVRMLTGLLPLGDPRIRVFRHPQSDAEPAESSADAVIVRRTPGAAVTAETIRRLVTAARRGPVAPVWISPEGAVASAGLLAHDGRVYRALQGFPREDAAAAGDELLVAALDSPLVAAIGGDRRPPRTLLGETVVGPDADRPPIAEDLVDSPLTDLPPRGLRRAGWIADDGGAARPRYVADRTSISLPDGSAVPRLRWAIKTAAPAGPRGESWGETHFARSLAAALERLGQYVAVDSRPALDRTSSEYDDVVLCLRGPHPLPAPDVQHRLLWIISHPDEITAAEVSGYDRVFAGSTAWARIATERFGVPIAPLLQCTDAYRFRPSGAARGDDLVFVGTARGIARPAVVVPVRAGRPVRVYGPDWRGYIPGSAIAGTHLPNDDVPAVYESAGAVLNDHWPAMRREGFVSNRLYDVIAAGGRAISDDVEGIDEIFGRAVRQFRDERELLELTDVPLDERFPSDAELAQISERIRREHSFDARARRLVDTVLDPSETAL
ncbi:Glycosyl transferases group 1 [Microbacterium azadirachtae]|uniref:Glycosyl transferases group 1 n=1 Tax=Microbacterium azadirachtae TaxID=582680 RepID=A0A1I6GJ53_9MICO|nr:glycosyltransferase [Microbacterium azadirachtae]SFR42206.1 Glycosyl transferases group 1 [Microbacterium azadirachtae]